MSELLKEFSRKATLAYAQQRHALAPAADDAFHAFSKAVFAPGALDARTCLRLDTFIEMLKDIK